MPVDKIKNYTKTLQEWVNATGKKQKEIAELTACFHFDDDGPSRQPMSESQFSRTVKPQKIPARPEGIFNLFSVLGVLHALNVVDKDEIEEFLSEYQIYPPYQKDSRDLSKFWQNAEEGRSQLLKGLTTGIHPQPTGDDVLSTQDRINREEASTNASKPMVKGRLTWAAVFIAVGIIMILAFSFFVSTLAGTPEISATSPAGIPTPPNIRTSQMPLIACDTLISLTPPVFLPDQAFSLYEPSIPSGESILSNHIRSIGINPKGLWVGYAQTDAGIGRVSFFNSDEWIHYCLGQELKAGQLVNGFAFDDETVYIATDGAGIGQFNGTTWAFYTTEDGLYNNSIYELDLDNEGLWASTFMGVARLDGQSWIPAYNAKSGELVSDHVHAYLRDRAGNRWFGTIQNGISCLDSEGKWSSYYQQDIYHQDIRRIAEDDAGGIWFTTYKGGVLRFYKGEWSIFDKEHGQLPNNQATDVEKDNLGRIWVATDGGLVYTPDLGQTWIVHSTLPVVEIEFGCPNCVYQENQLWLIVKDLGLGNVHIPPLAPTVQIVSQPESVRLKPGEPYVFEVVVSVLSEQLTISDGDSLRSILPSGKNLFGAWPVIPVVTKVAPGETYTFSNVNNPIIAPSEPGVYWIPWRVWQGKRFVTDPIIVEFEVLDK